jgi:replicative DNA helicase
MSSPQLVQRMLCSRGKINLQKIRNGFLSERDFPALTAVAAKLSASPLFIDDTAAAIVTSLRPLSNPRRGNSRAIILCHTKKLSQLFENDIGGVHASDRKIDWRISTGRAEREYLGT